MDAKDSFRNLWRLFVLADRDTGRKTEGKLKTERKLKTNRRQKSEKKAERR